MVVSKGVGGHGDWGAERTDGARYWRSVVRRERK